ncbi:hypothetical protein ACSYGO_45470 [Streptomyces krungchingensis]
MHEEQTEQHRAHGQQPGHARPACMSAAHVLSPSFLTARDHSYHHTGVGYQEAAARELAGGDVVADVLGLRGFGVEVTHAGADEATHERVQVLLDVGEALAPVYQRCQLGALGRSWAMSTYARGTASGCSHPELLLEPLPAVLDAVKLTHPPAGATDGSPAAA